MQNAIKILIVDDSSLVRKILRNLFKDDSEILIEDEAQDGLDALEKIKVNKFDLVISDFEMPKMNGLDFLRALAKEPDIDKKPPVIMLSSLTEKGSRETIQCLMAGARDYVHKPSQSLAGSSRLDDLKKILSQKITTIVISEREKMLTKPSLKYNLSNKVVLKDPGLMVVGSSTGGVSALEKVLKDIPATFRLPILVVQHMPPAFTKTMADILNKASALNVTEVLETTSIKPGHVYIAPGGKHMLLSQNGCIELKESEPVNFCIPSVDVLFESVANHYRRGVVSLILTGMGSDGCNGVEKLKQKLNCYSIIQDQESSVVWSMPKAVHQKGLSDIELPIDKIGSFVANI